MQPTTEMMDTIIQIMVEILSILGIATKEIKEGRLSERFHTSISESPLTEGCLEKYGKRLIGRNDMEDALQRLDKLTQEEARMAVAENLKATHIVDERVRGVANTVVAIDNRVACVDDRVAGVDDRVASVDNRVAGVNDKVEGIANDVDQVKRSSFHFIVTDNGALHVHHSRGPIAGKHPQMALPTGSIN